MPILHFISFFVIFKNFDIKRRGERLERKRKRAGDREDRPAAANAGHKKITEPVLPGSVHVR